MYTISSLGRATDNFPPPLVLVSVASKELRITVSPLFATFTGRFVSVAVKELREEEARR